MRVCCKQLMTSDLLPISDTSTRTLVGQLLCSSMLPAEMAHAPLNAQLTFVSAIFVSRCA